jgi:hypothetical protein
MDLPNWKAFLLELMIYAALVVVYFVLVLHFFSGWFKELFDHDRRMFAVMALAVMIGQTVGLEIVSNTLVWLFRRKSK